MNEIFEKRSVPVSLIFFKKMRTYPLLFHKHVELTYVLDGDVTVTIDGQTETLHSGDLSVAFPYILHTSQATDASTVVLLFDPAVCGSLYEIFSAKKPLSPVIRKEDLPECVPRLLEEIGLSRKRKSSCSEAISYGYITVLLGNVLEKLTLEAFDNSKLTTAQSVLLYCMQNYKTDISLEQLSKALCISKVHITYTFTKKLHTSFRNYINMLRISNAQELLAKSDTPITEIMYDCGFNNQGTFNRVFHDICHVTPSEYRRRSIGSSDTTGKKYEGGTLRS